MLSFAFYHTNILSYVTTFFSSVMIQCYLIRSGVVPIIAAIVAIAVVVSTFRHNYGNDDGDDGHGCVVDSSRGKWRRG